MMQILLHQMAVMLCTIRPGGQLVSTSLEDFATHHLTPVTQVPSLSEWIMYVCASVVLTTYSLVLYVHLLPSVGTRLWMVAQHIPAVCMFSKTCMWNRVPNALLGHSVGLWIFPLEIPRFYVLVVGTPLKLTKLSKLNSQYRLYRTWSPTSA